MSQLTDFSGVPESEAQAIRNILVGRGALRLTDRQDDQPFKGGGGIVGVNGGLTGQLKECTAGYVVEKAGKQFMVTAGH